MILNNLMDQFLKLEFSAITYGPCHFDSPREDLVGLHLDFVQNHQYLTDEMYKEFLSVYGGAGLYSELDSTDPHYIFLSIYELDGPLVDGESEELSEGVFFVFAELCMREHQDQYQPDDGLVTYAYAFNVTGKTGVYREAYKGSDKIEEFKRVYPSFIEFLGDIVEREGSMLK